MNALRLPVLDLEVISRAGGSMVGSSEELDFVAWRTVIPADIAVCEPEDAGMRA